MFVNRTPSTLVYGVSRSPTPSAPARSKPQYMSIDLLVFGSNSFDIRLRSSLAHLRLRLRLAPNNNSVELSQITSPIYKITNMRFCNLSVNYKSGFVITNCTFVNLQHFVVLIYVNTGHTTNSHHECSQNVLV